ncbi:MAG: sulfurtransferase-like selenium metabolism protein YedF [Eubacteriales bacterium]
MELYIDARGDNCPIPVIKTRNAIRNLTEDGEINVQVDNYIAVQNLIKMANQLKITHQWTEIEENHFSVILQVGEEVPKETLPQKPTRQGQETDTVALLISSETLGVGEEKLGKLLMKGYLFTLLQEDIQPNVVIFINGGAKITSDPYSTSLEDLKELEKRGVTILTCGTCIDFYELDLQIGEVANMYEISQHLARANKVIHL